MEQEHVKFPFWLFDYPPKTIYFSNRGFHVGTTRKQQNLGIIVKRFEVACWEKTLNLEILKK